MHGPRFPRTAGGDERGVALPLALLGLVVVTLLVTAALLTSSTELAISSAHQDATRALHVSESGLQAYLDPSTGNPDGFINGFFTTVARDPSAKQFDQGMRFTPADWTTGGYAPPPGDASSERVRVQVRHLGRVVLPKIEPTDPNEPPRWRNLFSIESSPTTSRGGRAVSAMVMTHHELQILNTNIQGAMTSGADLEVRGNVKISGISQSTCAGVQDPDSVSAIQFAADAGFTDNSQEDRLIEGGQIEGGVDTASWNQSQLVKNVLGVDSLEVLAQRADVKFGAKFGQPAFNGTDPRSSRPRDDRYNWGCAPGSVDCPNAPYAKVVMIDAQGGSVTLNGTGNGYGILVIVNGNFVLNGTFNYRGIIIVEGVTKISGTADVIGALIAVGETQVDRDAASSVSSGTPIIRYDHCALSEVKKAFDDGGGLGAPPVLDSRLRWVEVVR